MWGDIHWGHAISKDMLHWRHLPVALAPTHDAADSAGCFTGTAAVLNGKLAVMYTGVRAVPLLEATVKDNPPCYRESQCMAFAEDDDLMQWHKLAAPAIDNPPENLCVNGFRDPSPWREGAWWYVVIGSGIANHGGAILLYRSRDMHQWQFVKILAQRTQGKAHDPFNPWECWECPEFFPLGDKHVLIYSAEGKCFWQCGRWDPSTLQFQAEETGLLDYGNCYAMKTQRDENGNRIAWGWLTETRPVEAFQKAGWAGVMSLPRQLSLNERGALTVQMAPAVHSLRGERQWIALHGDETAMHQQLRGVQLDACCGEFCFRVQSVGKGFALEFFAEHDPAGSVISIAWNAMSRDAMQIDGRPIQLDWSAERKTEVHMYVDGSTLEVIVNAEIAWSKRFYFGAQKNVNLCARGEGDLSAIDGIEIWQYAAISPDRLSH